MSDLQPLLRHWVLLRLLSTRRQGATIRELSGETQTPDRTIRRDLQKLCSAGFPLTETRSEHGRKHWKLDCDGLPQLNFTYPEALSLYLGRQFLEPLAGTYLWDGAQSAFLKIRSILPEPARKYLAKLASAFHQTTTGAGDYSQKGEILDVLMIGIEDRKFTTIVYQSAQATEPAGTCVYPYGLVNHRNRLYLVAFAPEHNEVRHYKVDRISEAELQDLRFTHPPTFDLQRHLSGSFGVFQGKGEPIRIKVRFTTASVVRYVEESRWHPSQKLARQRDGSLLAEFELGDVEEIKKWILSFGPNAVVLEPKRFRDQMTETLAATYANYQPQAQKFRHEKASG
jgi:proteasome accessory factor B